MEQQTRHSPSKPIHRFGPDMDRRLGEFLAQIGPKTKSVFSKKDLLERHLEGLRNAKALGYSPQELSEHLLRELGLQISPSSLREALRPPKVAQKPATPRRSRKPRQLSPAAPVAEAVAQRPAVARGAGVTAPPLPLFEAPPQAVFDPQNPFGDDPAGEA